MATRCTPKVTRSITRGTENYCRVVVVLTTICTEVLRAIVLHHVALSTPDQHVPTPWTIEEFLASHEPDIRKSLKEEKWKLSALFPRGKPPDIQKWDLSLLAFILLDISKIKQPIRMDVEKIKKVRNSLFHRSDASIDDVDFKSYFSHLKVCIKRCANFLGKPDLEEEMCALIRDAKHSALSIDESLRIIKEWYDSDKHIEEQLEEDRKDAQKMKTDVAAIKSDVGTIKSSIDEMMPMLKQIFKWVPTSSDASMFIPDTKVEIVVKNCGEEEEKKVSEMLANMLNLMLRNDPELQKLLSNDEYKLIYAHVEEAMKRLLSEQSEVKDVHTKCVVICIHCQNFDSFEALIHQSRSGRMNALFKPVEKAIRMLKGYEHVTLEVLVQDEEFCANMDTFIRNILSIFGFGHGEDSPNADQSRTMNTETKNTSESIRDVTIQLPDRCEDSAGNAQEGTHISINVRPRSISQYAHILNSCTSGSMTRTLQALADTLRDHFQLQNLSIEAKLAQKKSPEPINDETNYDVCSICQRENIQTKAIIHCKCCLEYLCNSCLSRHESVQDCGNHKHDTIEEISKGLPKAREMTRQCDGVPYANVNQYKNPFLPRLSEILTDTLDKIGFSEKDRTYTIKTGVMFDTISSITYILAGSADMCHIGMGSIVEGTQLIEKGSDLNGLIFSTSLKAYCTKESIKQTKGLLMIRDGTTPPGYTKLQLVYHGNIINESTLFDDITETFERDSKARLVMKHATAVSGKQTDSDGDEYAGLTKKLMLAHMCEDVPSEMEEWCNRTRKYDWPDKETRDLFKTQGCFMIAKGCPSSPEKHLQWQVSFPIQECYLMRHLNPTQVHCFILLKLLSRFLINPMFGQVLSSYHCKMLLFYTIERHKQRVWFPANLISCLRLCLLLLHEWISREYIPSYFIPGQNLFVGMEAILKNNYHNLVSCVHLISEDWRFLYEIRYQHLGEHLLKQINSKPIKEHPIVTNYFAPCQVVYPKTHILKDMSDCSHCIQWTKHTLNFLDAVHVVVQSTQACCRYKTFEETIQHLHREWFAKCTQASATSERLHRLPALFQYSVESEEREARECAVTVLKSVYQTELATSLVAHYFQTQDPQHLLESEKYFKLGESVDFITNGLKQAAVLLKQRLIQRSNILLNKVEGMCKDKMSGCCSCCCYSYMQKCHLTGQLKTIPVIEERCDFFDQKHIHKLINASCLTYLRCHLDILPQALTFEAYSSFGTSQTTDPLGVDMRIDAVNMDPFIYLYYLQFLSNKDNNPGEAAVALHKMESMLFERIAVQKIAVHADTWLNVLGDTFAKKGWSKLAMRCFKYSNKIQPQNNAVKWHIMFALFSPNNGAP